MQRGVALLMLMLMLIGAALIILISEPAFAERRVGAGNRHFAVQGRAAPQQSSTAMAGELLGYKGDRLKGSISCIHPNIIRDLTDRIGEEDNYTTVARIYVQQGYCIEVDIPTILRKPLADHSFTTWEGHKAEVWETTLILERGDGTKEEVSSYSIVFPREMEQNFTD